MLSRGTLKSFDMMLKIDTETPADANSTGPLEDKDRNSFKHDTDK